MRKNEVDLYGTIWKDVHNKWGKSDQQVRVCICMLEAYKKNICMCTEKYQKGYILNFKLNDYLGEY